LFLSSDAEDFWWNGPRKIVYIPKVLKSAALAYYRPLIMLEVLYKSHPTFSWSVSEFSIMSYVPISMVLFPSVAHKSHLFLLPISSKMLAITRNLFNK
jgi:hypothetical protein